MPRRRLTTIALILLLVVPPTAAAAQSPAGAAGPAPTDAAATPAETPPAPDASPSTVLQGLYRTAGVDPGDPAPLPPVADERPLATALEHLAEARGEDVDEAALEEARRDADDLPPDLRAALALIVEANAVATERNRQAAEAGTLDRTRSAQDALLVARAVDAALPILRKYSLFHASQAQALQLEQARTVDAVVAAATGSEPLQASGTDGDLPGAVLDLYDALGVEATPTDTDRLDAGAEALPDDVRRAATVTVEAQARSARLRAEAFQDLDQAALATLSDRDAAGGLEGEASATNLDDARAWLAATDDVDRAKLAQAQLAVATAALQANAILDGRDRQETDGDQGILDTLWNGLKTLVSTLNPVATAQAQATTGSCPRTSPLSDCGNDVWFTDPFGIVVISGPGSTLYDARYGQRTLDDRVSEPLRRLPTDGINVESRDYVGGTGITVEGSLPREIAENQTARPSIRTLDESTLNRTYYAATLDLGGDDVYVHHTASTGVLEEQVAASSNPGIDADELPLLGTLLVDAGGDDTYDPGLANRSAGSIARAGTAGLAVLLDAAGDDVYRGGNQSVASATALGRSVLLDLDGHDNYTAAAGSAGSADLLGSALLLDDCAAFAGDACRGSNDTVQAGPRSQGWGNLAGVGVLVNRGGSDTYDLATSAGQGEGSAFGLGAFVDVAGEDDVGVHPGDEGDSLDGLDPDEDPTAEVVARPNDEPVRATVWAQEPGTGNGLALEVDHPAALQLGPSGMGVIASFERAEAPGVKLPGLFFVDGATDTLYDQPYAITVDLAGFDTYENNAGGAINLSDASGAEGAAGTALALDLAGADRYDARDLDQASWGVQGAARNGAGLLLDVGRSPDTYLADDRAQGAAGSDGVGLLLDDGAVEDSRDRFEAADNAQGYGRVGGIGALVTLDGDTTYEAGDRSQGFGYAAGAGLLVDRRILATSLTDRPNVPEPSGDDTYRAGAQAQGAAFAGGIGLLADLGGDDAYSVADQGQGFADPTELETPPGVDVKRPRTVADASRGLLVDLSGRDDYEARTSPARAHGYATEDTSQVRSRALLADFALPNVPIVRLDDLPLFAQGTGGYVGGLLDQTQETRSPTGDQVFADWDPTGFYDDWLRQGRGDDYAPGETPSGQPKAENGYWEQPRTNDTKATAGDRTVTAPTAERPSAGLGMDNPPIAAPKAGSDRFFAAARMVDEFLAASEPFQDGHDAVNGTNETAGEATEPAFDEASAATDRTIAGAIVQRTRPDVTLHVHPFDGNECHRSTDVNLTDAGQDVVCLEAHVDNGGFTADPDRNMDVDFDLRARGDGPWKDVGENTTLTYYGSVQRTYGENLGDTGYLSLAGFDGGFSIPPDVPVPEVDPAGSDTVGILLDSDALCGATGGTGYCPDDPDAHRVEALAWPDGNYTARATVSTVGTTLTAGRAQSRDTAPMALDNAPRLLGVDVQHPNPVAGTPGTFTLYASEPHRGYEIDVLQGPDQVRTRLAAQAATSSIGTPDADASPVDGRNVTATTVTWPAGDEFPPADRYRYDATLNRFEGEMAAVHSLDLQSNTSEAIGVTLDQQISRAAAAHVSGAGLVAGGVDDEGLRDQVLALDPDGPSLSQQATLPDPLADAAAASVGDAMYLFGGQTPSGPSDAVVRVQGGSAQTLSAELPAPVVNATAAYHPDEARILVFGGQGPDGPRDEVLAFDPASGTVETLNATLPEPLARAGAASTADADDSDADDPGTGGTYIAGGVTETGRTNLILEFVPEDEAVRVAGSLPRATADAAVVAFDHQVFAVGGTTDAGPQHRVARFDTVETTTTTMPLTTPHPRNDTIVSMASPNEVYVYGAGSFVPSASPFVEDTGNVTVDPDPPTVDLTLNASAVGCAEPTCQGTVGAIEAQVPFRAHDAGSGVAEVQVALSAGGETVTRAVTPEEPTPSTFEAHAARNVSHGQRLEVTAVPVDGAGHRGASASATYFVDLQPPTAATTLPRAPSSEAGFALQNDTAFPVGWRNVSSDVTEVQVWYRVHGAHDDFRRGVTVDATGPGETTFEAGAVAPDLVGDGTILDVRVRAVDDAGNLQPLDATRNRTVELDLRSPEIRSVDVDPGFKSAVVRYNLTEPGIVHKATVLGPDGVADTLHRVRTTDQITFVVADLDSGTTYDVTLESLDRARNPAATTVNFTTESSLSLDWGAPEPGALLSGDANLTFQVGAAPEARGDTTHVTLRAEASNGSVPLVKDLVVGVEGNRSDPAPPSVTPYPIPVDTDDAPEGAGLTLQLVARNAHGSTSATRTVTIDNTPPTLPPNATPALEGPRGPAEEGIPWFRGPANVTDVPATDAVSGVNRTLYGWTARTVDQPFDPAEPPNRTGEGIHAFHHRSVDEAGNVENASHVHRFGIDLTAPTLDPVLEDRSPEDRNVNLQVNATDGLSGVLHVRTHLAGDDAGPWLPVNASTTSPTVTLPERDGRHTVTVEARDRAGNVGSANVSVVYSTRPPALEGAPSVEAVSPVAAQVTWTTDKASHTNLALPDAPGEVRVETVGLTTRHHVRVTGLEPGTETRAVVTLEGAAGRTSEARLNLTTPDDPSPPTSVGNLTAVDTGAGVVAIAWAPAQDEAGVARYRVDRAPVDGTFETVANVSRTQVVDRDVDLGTAYRYRVHAIDNAGKLGPGENATVTPTMPPAIQDPVYDAGTVNGTAVLFLEVTVVERGRPVQEVRAVADGTHVELTRVNATDDGIVYQGTVEGTNLTVEDGVDVAFEADGPRTTVRHPTNGTFHADAEAFSGGDDGTIPGPGAWALVAVLAAALALRRRDGGPGEGPGSGGHDPRNLM